jgi:hypothetical protein
MKTSTLACAAAGLLLASGASAHAQTESHAKKLHHRHPPSTPANAQRALGSLTAEVEALRGQVQTLQERLSAQSTAQAQTQAQVQQASALVTAAQQKIQSVEDKDEQATALAIQRIPVQVATAVDEARTNSDGLYFKGLKITPGGFLELANQYRSRALGSDMFSPFAAIPFNNSGPGHESEDRFSARQSRLSALVQGDINPGTQVAIYGEIDFLGAAQSANYNESNSFNPRLRNLYATVDWTNSGWHLLAGQSWSLATLNSNGITPRNEQPPPMIDAQFVPGFVWTRQPQIRITKDFNKTLWLSVSLESPQTTFSGTPPAGVIIAIPNSTGLYAGATGATAPIDAGGGAAVIPTAATSSLNSVPDVIGKAAYETRIDGRRLHAEVFGLGRGFNERIAGSNQTVYGGGIGAGLIFALVPSLIDVQATTLTGRGIGRYGTSQLPDVTFSPSGRLKPIGETDWLAGVTVHATKALDVYVFAGEEREDRQAYAGNVGLGGTQLNLSGCYTEGGACSAATNSVEQGTVGFWDKIYQGSFGHVQVGLQYSYTERRAFSGLDGLTPATNDNIVFASLRYYPF